MVVLVEQLSSPEVGEPNYQEGSSLKEGVSDAGERSRRPKMSGFGTSNQNRFHWNSGKASITVNNSVDFLVRSRQWCFFILVAWLCGPKESGDTQPTSAIFASQSFTNSVR
jgi:hypothetical protein